MHDMDAEELFYFSTDLFVLTFLTYIHYLHKDDTCITKASSEYVYDVLFNCCVKQVEYHTMLLWQFIHHNKEMYIFCVHTIKILLW